MTMFQTLFGGAFLIIALYYALRALGVSNYWRGVISGTASVTAYLALSIASWPGGDVVSMHMAVFLATATALTLIGGRRPGAGKGLHWGPRVIIGFFLILFVIDGTLLMISGQGLPPALARWLLPAPENNPSTPIHTAFSGVVPHGEEAAKTINQFMSAAEKQRRLGWSVTLSGLDGLRQGSRPAVSVTARDAAAQSLQGAMARLAIIRPGLSRPEQVSDLVETDPGVYRGQLAPVLPGTWVVAVQLRRGDERFEMQRHIEVSAAQ